MPPIAPSFEHVLLVCHPDPRVFDVPIGAKACRIPNRDDAPPDLQGATFVRTGEVDGYSGLPLFRRATRQL